MNSEENNKSVEVANDEQQQHLVEPTNNVAKADDESAAPNAENDQAATDSAENKSEEIAQAKKNVSMIINKKAYLKIDFL